MPYWAGRDVDRQAYRQEGRYASWQLSWQEVGRKPGWLVGRQATLENTIDIVVYRYRENNHTLDHLIWVKHQLKSKSASVLNEKCNENLVNPLCSKVMLVYNLSQALALFLCRSHYILVYNICECVCLCVFMCGV